MEIKEDDLLRIGFSRQKKTYAHGLSQAVLNGNFDFDILGSMPDETLRPYLKSIKGVGDWTVDVYSLMCLLRPVCFPKVISLFTKASAPFIRLTLDRTMYFLKIIPNIGDLGAALAHGYSGIFTFANELNSGQ